MGLGLESFPFPMSLSEVYFYYIGLFVRYMQKQCPGVNSLLLPHGFQIVNSGHQIWWQTTLFTLPAGSSSLLSGVKRQLEQLSFRTTSEVPNQWSILDSSPHLTQYRGHRDMEPDTGLQIPASRFL